MEQPATLQMPAFNRVTTKHPELIDAMLQSQYPAFRNGRSSDLEGFLLQAAVSYDSFLYGSRRPSAFARQC